MLGIFLCLAAFFGSFLPCFLAGWLYLKRKSVRYLIVGLGSSYILLGLGFYFVFDIGTPVLDNPIYTVIAETLAFGAIQ